MLYISRGSVNVEFYFMINLNSTTNLTSSSSNATMDELISEAISETLNKYFDASNVSSVSDETQTAAGKILGVLVYLFVQF